MTYTSAFDLFKIGIGPSSSHTVGPMLAALQMSPAAASGVTVELYGSLALTGDGHGTDRAIMLGLSGHHPETVPLDLVWSLPATVRRTQRLTVADGTEIDFDPDTDIVRHREIDPIHPNLMRFSTPEVTRTFASVGGGFLVEVVEGELTGPEEPTVDLPFTFQTAAELLALAEGNRVSIAEIAWRNERALDPDGDLSLRLSRIVDAMSKSIDRGLRATGVLPGPLGIKRRARDLGLDLEEVGPFLHLPPTGPSDWAGVFATAVNEENAAGGRIVTAPTNGAAGIIPAVLRFATQFCTPATADPAEEFLLTAAAIGSLLKANAGISGAELGDDAVLGERLAGCERHAFRPHERDVLFRQRGVGLGQDAHEVLRLERVEMFLKIGMRNYHDRS